MRGLTLHHSTFYTATTIVVERRLPQNRKDPVVSAILEAMCPNCTPPPHKTDGGEEGKSESRQIDDILHYSSGTGGGSERQNTHQIEEDIPPFFVRRLLHVPPVLSLFGFRKKGHGRFQVAKLLFHGASHAVNDIAGVHDVFFVQLVVVVVFHHFVARVVVGRFLGGLCRCHGRQLLWIMKDGAMQVSSVSFCCGFGNLDNQQCCIVLYVAD